MIRVLFVCLGNICRSPLAEGIFVKRAEEINLTAHFSCDSAGTHDYHRGNQPDGRSVKVAKENGIILNHKARKVELNDFQDFDFFMVMDESVMEFLHRMKPKESKAKLLFMRNFDPQAPQNNEVPDPYYGDINDFKEVFEMLDAASLQLLNKYKHQENWA
jgi:protein-tyrosine phosphatase